MFRKLYKGEGGYSLVEVMVTIVILAVAIIPMVAMFDAGLRAAVLGGNYDKARALANTNLEEVKTQSFSDVETLTSCPDTATGFSCDLDKTYLKADLSSSSGGQDTGYLEVEITVEWGGGSEYTTKGLVVRGTP